APPPKSAPTPPATKLHALPRSDDGSSPQTSPHADLKTGGFLRRAILQYNKHPLDHPVPRMFPPFHNVRRFQPFTPCFVLHRHPLTTRKASRVEIPLTIYNLAPPRPTRKRHVSYRANAPIVFNRQSRMLQH